MIVSGPRLTLTNTGRRFAATRRLRHAIKSADRLLGDGKLQGETSMFYSAMCEARSSPQRSRRTTLTILTTLRSLAGIHYVSPGPS
jgi:hypothetical protein